MSILEAMAAGLPIISTNVGGIKDVVQENGILVQDDDKSALYEAMKEMMIAPNDKITRYSRESIRIVQNYSAKKMAEKYITIYERLVGSC